MENKSYNLMKPTEKLEKWLMEQWGKVQRDEIQLFFPVSVSYKIETPFGSATVISGNLYSTN